jgi:uncharacterized membrane protein
MFPWHQYLLALIFIVGGFFHLHKPYIYLKITPTYIPFKKTIVLVTGIIEMIAGFMLITKESQEYGAVLILILLLAFFSVHIHMLVNKKASLKLPKWALWGRLFLQFILIYWAFLYF